MDLLSVQTRVNLLALLAVLVKAHAIKIDKHSNEMIALASRLDDLGFAMHASPEDLVITRAGKEHLARTAHPTYLDAPQIPSDVSVFDMKSIARCFPSLSAADNPETVQHTGRINT